MRLKDKVAFITGAGSGVGRATARIFAKEGANIVVADIDESAGRETVDIVKQQGGDAVFVRCDVAVEADIKSAVEKGALISLTRSMAIVYAKNNIRANIIHPGPVDTPMQKEWDEETKKEISAWVPLGRLASAEDIANCGLFLASEESAYITGTEIIVDGGIMVKGR